MFENNNKNNKNQVEVNFEGQILVAHENCASLDGSYQRKQFY